MRDIQVKNNEKLVNFIWENGEVSSIAIRALRGNCPCAICQGHQGEKVYIENKTDTIIEASLVGRYAVSFHFADGHKSGIYRFDSLKSICQERPHV